MADTAASMAMIIFGLLIIVILLRVLVLVHRQTRRMDELKRQLKLSETAGEEKEKN